MAKSWLFVISFAFFVDVSMQVPCPTGWKGFGNSCYLFVLHNLEIPRMAWDESRSYCKAFGGELVSITNSSEVDFIYNQTKSIGNYAFWIGLYRNKTTGNPKEGWVWSDGRNFTNPQQWRSHEPNNYLNNEKCAELVSTSKNWNDNDCMKKFSLICERGKGDPPFTTQNPGTLPPTKDPPPTCDYGWVSYNRSCYKFEYARRSWNDAKRACRDTGGHLAKIDNENEQRFLSLKARSSYQNFWIGLNDLEVAGRFVWESDKSTVSYKHWQTGEPNGFKTVHCVELYGYVQAGLWNDERCASRKQYICEKEEGKNMCPENWVSYNDNCYQFNLESSQKLSWSAAKSACNYTGGFSSLVTIKSKEEQDFITKQVRAFSTFEVWIGLSDISSETTFKWSDHTSSLLIDTKFSMWANGNPTENKEDKDCVLLIGSRIDGAWSVQSCTTKLNFICMRHRDLSFCNVPLGMENGNIRDSQITASSSRPENRPKNARFNRNGSWCPAHSNKNDYLQIDLGSLYDIKKVLIEGNLTSFSIRYGKDGKQYRNYIGSLKKPITTTPINLNSLTARFVQIYPLSRTGYPCLRLEFIGCPAQETKTTDCSGPNWEKGPGNLCYQINKSYRSWTDARSTCLDQGADLLSIGTVEEKNAITKRIKVLTGVRSLWISLNDRDFEAFQYWSNGEENPLFNWGSGNPPRPNSDASLLKSCVEIQTSSGTWKDISCNSRRPYICMKRDDTPTWGNVVNDGFTGFWMGSSKYYWPLSSVDNNIVLGTKLGKTYGKIIPTTGVKNTSNTALQFSTGSYIDTGNFTKECLTFPDTCTNGLTISFMASFDSSAVNWQKVDILNSIGDQSNSPGLAVYVERQYLYFVVSKAHKFWTEKVAIVGDKAWRHYVMRWNESGLNIYINAQLKVTNENPQKRTANLNGKKNKFYIGPQSKPQVSSGKLNIAMVAFWERMLTEKDISSIYRAEFGRCPFAWSEYGMSCYQFQPAPIKSFVLATKDCQSLGGDLVNIASSVEQSFIMQNVYKNSWIGVHDSGQEGVFKQTNDEVIKFSNWNGGEPNDVFSEDCTEIRAGKGVWNDMPCHWNLPYICEKQKDLIVKPPNASISKSPKFQRICHYSRTVIGCPAGLVIKINSAFWGRRRKDVCRYISITNCGLDKIATTTKNIQRQCNNGVKCELHASEREIYLSNPCAGVRKYLEVNYSCVAKTTVPANCLSGWKVSSDKRACYRLFDTPKNWDDAKATCKSNKADLISIATSLEQAIATSLMERAWYANVWTGLNDFKTKGVYQWSDGTPVTWTNWYAGQPDERRTDKSCVFMSLQRTKRGWMFWRDANCSNTFAFMCKQPIGSQQKPTKTPVSTALCGKGSIGYSGSPYCYKVIKQQLTWPAAKLYCKRLRWPGRYGVRSQLASIKDARENEFIRKLSNDSMWIGLDDRGAYRGHAWSDDKPVSYTNWDIGQPDSYNGLEACVQINPDRGYWSDVDCFTMKSFVCKAVSYTTISTSPTPTPYPTPGSPHCKKNWTLFNGMCYYVGNDSYADIRTWHDAELTCQKMNGHLTSIKSDTETLFLKNLIKNKKSWSYWIGLNDLGSESNYEWVDGTKYGGYVNWGDNEPNDFRRQEDCIQIRKYDGKWNDQHCSWKMSYICKSYNESYHPLVTTVPPRPDKDGYCAPGWLANGRWCYEFHTDPSDYRTWWDAKDACEKGHNSSDLGELVSINNEFEEAFITVQIKGAKAPLWTGLNSHHGWRRFFWADNSPTNYFKWNTNQPRFRWSSCVEIVPYHWAAGRWNALSCYRKIGYICKTAASRTPITATPAYTPTPTAPPSFTCPQGYKVYEESCYKFVNSPKTFDDARKTCNNENAELMSVDSQFKQAYLIYSLERFIGSVWIGLLHEPYSVFRFTDNSSPVYTYWGSQQPNRQLDQRSCTQANITGSNFGLWDDVDCAKINPFVCQIYNGEPKITIPINSTCPQHWHQYDKFCYKHFNSFKTWSQAQYSCSALGSNLISIHTDQEQDFLIYYYQNKYTSSIWTGLNDRNRERGYEWIDKSALNYVNWYPNEPNDHNGLENCVTMETRNGKWNDLTCARAMPYMCKHILECSSPLSIDPSTITVTESINSTSLGASQAIINDDQSNEFAWCTNNTSGTAKITVDLNRLVQVTKISIQGRYPSRRFVRSFRIDIGQDGYWKPYTFSGFQNIITGNLDSKQVVTRTFDRPITLDQISITPVTWADQEICMKFLLHGCDYVCQNNLIKSPAKVNDDLTIAAKSSKDLKSSLRIQASPVGNGWCAKSNDKDQWIQVNFKKPRLISKIRTYGNGKDSYVKSYKIQFSGDGVKWDDYQQHGHVRIFNGNNEAKYPLVHMLSNTIEATHIRILPVSWNKNICMRFTLHGCEADCDKALLLKEQGGTDVTFSSSDKESHPEYALFNSGKAWCTKKSPLNSQYLQIDLGGRFRLKKIATQGSPLDYGKPRQVFTFTIKFMTGRVRWKNYLTSDKRQIKIFRAGNSNSSTKLVTNAFYGAGLATRKLRIFPKDLEGTEICMRVEIYGCYSGVEIIRTTPSTRRKSTPSTRQTIVDASVRFTSLEWDEKLNDKESEQFKTMSVKIVKAVGIVYKASESFRKVQVQKLSKGSVIALLKMVFNQAFNENKTQLLEDAVKSGKVGTLDADKESFKIIDVTPQARSGDKSSGLSAGGVAGVVITILFIAFLAVAGGLLYYRHRKRKQLFSPQHFDNPISYSSKAYDMDE